MFDFACSTETFGEALEGRGDFRTPGDPEAGWASRNPDRALLFLYVCPRDCGAVEELMAL